MTSKTSGKAVVTLPSDREIMITRTFNAPADLVFEAMTTPEHVAKWYGPRSDELVECEIDLRVGGSWRYRLRNPEGVEYGFYGAYKELDAPHRWVSTEAFDGFPEAEAISTVTLVENKAKTTLTTVVLHENQQFRDGHLNSGMEAGMQETFDRLEELLETIT